MTEFSFLSFQRESFDSILHDLHRSCNVRTNHGMDVSDEADANTDDHMFCAPSQLQASTRAPSPSGDLELLPSPVSSCGSAVTTPRIGSQQSRSRRWSFPSADSASDRARVRQLTDIFERLEPQQMPQKRPSSMLATHPGQNMNGVAQEPLRKVQVGSAVTRHEADVNDGIVVVRRRAAADTQELFGPRYGPARAMPDATPGMMWQVGRKMQQLVVKGDRNSQFYRDLKRQMRHNVDTSDQSEEVLEKTLDMVSTRVVPAGNPEMICQCDVRGAGTECIDNHVLQEQGCCNVDTMDQTEAMLEKTDDMSFAHAMPAAAAGKMWHCTNPRADTKSTDHHVVQQQGGCNIDECNQSKVMHEKRLGMSFWRVVSEATLNMMWYVGGKKHCSSPSACTESTNGHVVQEHVDCSVIASNQSDMLLQKTRGMSPARGMPETTPAKTWEGDQKRHCDDRGAGTDNTDHYVVPEQMGCNVATCDQCDVMSDKTQGMMRHVDGKESTDHDAVQEQMGCKSVTSDQSIAMPETTHGMSSARAMPAATPGMTLHCGQKRHCNDRDAGAENTDHSVGSEQVGCNVATCDQCEVMSEKTLGTMWHVDREESTDHKMVQEQLGCNGTKTDQGIVLPENTLSTSSARAMLAATPGMTLHCGQNRHCNDRDAGNESTDHYVVPEQVGCNVATCDQCDVMSDKTQGMMRHVDGKQEQMGCSSVTSDQSIAMPENTHGMGSARAMPAATLGMTLHCGQNRHCDDLDAGIESIDHDAVQEQGVCKVATFDQRQVVPQKTDGMMTLPCVSSGSAHDTSDFGFALNKKMQASTEEHFVCTKSRSNKRVLRGSKLGVVTVSAATGAAVMGPVGAATGAVVGGVVGGALGVVPALVTFGMSIPIGVALGGGAGSCIGTVTGTMSGILTGSAVGGFLVRGTGKRQRTNCSHEVSCPLELISGK
eukprot:TRINITY_DN5756_c0_g1_i1.p1 TRINITY_DN5756_c0_g1~~TRINITY_DN5756_c0_g1_i1.p1  ORF type:complete len:952 (-),score=148.08 TRINITY_DN5756_c0_g1_i1:107-2923(-)